MKNYKCSQCGLVNWINQVNCKRCHVPNPYAVPVQGATEMGFQPSPELQNSPTGAAFHQPSNFAPSHQPAPPPFRNGGNIDFTAPPPPNAYGQEFGQAQGFAPRPTRRQIPSAVYAEFETAKKHIKNARKAGVAWCVLAGLLGIILVLLMLLVVSQKSPEASILAFIPLAVVVFIVGIIGGLTFGVSRNSRVCAVILVSFTGLSLLGNILGMLAGGQPQNIASVLFATLFTYYFGYGVYGTFTYHKLINQYPELKN